MTGEVAALVSAAGVGASLQTGAADTGGNPHPDRHTVSVEIV